MNWRELLTESEGATPKGNIRNNSKTPFKEGETGGFAYFADIARVSPPVRPAPRMAPDVRKQMAADSETLFIHFSRRLYDRLSRVMAPGYLARMQTHEAELWARREALRKAWDDPQVWIEFKTCAVPWAEYRGRIYQWASVELACIRKHREETF